MVLSVLRGTYTRIIPISELVLKLWFRNLRCYLVSNTRNYISEELAVSFYRVEYLFPLISTSHPKLPSLSETKFDTREHWSVKSRIFRCPGNDAGFAGAIIKMTESQATRRASPTALYPLK